VVGHDVGERVDRRQADQAAVAADPDSGLEARPDWPIDQALASSTTVERIAFLGKCSRTSEQSVQADRGWRSHLPWVTHIRPPACPDRSR
jgi:hypothetical protein